MVHSLPPASISSLEQFHASFNAHCQKFYPFELIFHSCCKGYNDFTQDIADLEAGCEDEGDDLDQKLVLSLPYSSASDESCVCCPSEESAKIEPVMEIDFPCIPFSKEPRYEQHIFDSFEDVEDIPALGEEVLDNPVCLEEVISNVEQEQPIFYEYPSEEEEGVDMHLFSSPAVITKPHNEEHNFFMGLVYDDYESDPWESQEEEPEEQ